MARSRAPRIIRHILKLLLVLIILVVSGLLFWRVCASEDYEITKGITVNEQVKAAYAEYGDGLILQYQKDRATITKAEKNYGYFSVVEYVYLPQIKQLQLVFRYNNSTLEHLKADYALSEIPNRETDLYDLTLTLTTDLTPEDPSDNLQQDKLQSHRIHASSEPVRETTTLYNYRRYTFDNVDIKPETVGVFLDIYYVGDVNYDLDAYGTLLLYDRSAPWVPYELSSDELKRLKGE
ncbi:MAG: hypothetical protein IJW16_00940 [Clostridia bacterium]|nr:hypothetical protein [Clostridia bacterium]